VSWTDERVELLKKMWSEGLTASQIANKLGGVSRNAVIGKVHRLKLESRATAPKRAGSGQRKPVSAGSSSAGRSAATRRSSGSTGGGGGAINTSAAGRSSTVTQTVGATVMKAEIEDETLAQMDTRPVEDVVVPIARKLTLVEITEQTCKFPYGDPLSEDFHFCGHDVDGESPYCKYHGKVVYQQPQDRRRKN
jgi:GcrA cell cycle regulator